MLKMFIVSETDKKVAYADVVKQVDGSSDNSSTNGLI